MLGHVGFIKPSSALANSGLVCVMLHCCRYFTGCVCVISFDNIVLLYDRCTVWLCAFNIMTYSPVYPRQPSLWSVPTQKWYDLCDFNITYSPIMPQAVLAVECSNKESIYGYHGNRSIPFLRITMALPRLIAPAKRLLEAGFRCPHLPERAYSTYESNIDYEVSGVHGVSVLKWCL